MKGRGGIRVSEAVSPDASEPRAEEQAGIEEVGEEGWAVAFWRLERRCWLMANWAGLWGFRRQMRAGRDQWE